MAAALLLPCRPLSAAAAAASAVAAVGCLRAEPPRFPPRRPSASGGREPLRRWPCHGGSLASCSGPAPAPRPDFSELLRQDSRALLQEAVLKCGQETGCDPEASRPPAELLAALGAPEMAGLFRRVEALVALVDSMASAGSARPPDAEALLEVRQAYSAFLASLEEVYQAIFGDAARPFSLTRWWAPVYLRWRYHVCSLFSWGLIPEAIVAEAAGVLRGLGAAGLIDPLAGSGWHARLWQDVGRMQVVALDSYPVRPVPWINVEVVADSRKVLGWGVAGAEGGPSLQAWILFLSWPPHSPERVGLELLQRWPGDFLVYVGERGSWTEEGLTGGRALLDAIQADWEPVRSWAIPRWPGYEDDLTVYLRRKPGLPG
ncbi:unnamed protein product [Prorocentrum cordatum]|uniref:Uncharacterized protein n=1 Tax=Prorocentrum cordatum TaxID=2364126 RepID=A0ABN9QVW7_9DINO|nr:unnamed protein product [Polarella glacialis]